MNLLESVLHAAVYTGVGLAVLLAGWLVLDAITPGHLGRRVFAERSVSAAVVASAAQIGLAAVVFTAIWSNGGGLGDGLLWTLVFGLVGVLLQLVAFLLLDLVTPGKLGDIICETGFHPAALIAAASQVAVAAIVCASIS